MEAPSDLFTLLLTSRLFKVEAEKRLYARIVCGTGRGDNPKILVHYNTKPLYHVCRSLDVAVHVHTLDLHRFRPFQTDKERLFPQLATAYLSMHRLKTLRLPKLDSELIDAIPFPYCNFRLRIFGLLEMKGNVAMRRKLSVFMEQQTEIREFEYGADFPPDARDVITNLPAQSLPKLHSLQMRLAPALNFLPKGRRIASARILHNFMDDDADVTISLEKPLTHLRSLRTRWNALPSFSGRLPSLNRLQLDGVMLFQTSCFAQRSDTPN